MVKKQTVQFSYQLHSNFNTLHMPEGSEIERCQYCDGKYYLIIQAPCCIPTSKSIPRTFVRVQGPDEFKALEDNTNLKIKGHVGAFDTSEGFSPVVDLWELETDPNTMVTLG